MASPFDRIGQTGLVRYGGRVYEEWHPRLQGTLAVRTYREMADNDATIGAVMGLTENVIRQVKWFAEPADGSAKAKAWAEFLERTFSQMDHTWADFVSDLLSMLVFGWSVFEKVYKRDADGRVAIAELGVRSQEAFDDWEFDEDTGAVLGMYQRAAPYWQRVFIPAEKLVLFRTKSGRNNPEGRSLLRNAYRSWWFLKRLQEIEAIGIERDLVGLPIAFIPAEAMDEDAPVRLKRIRGTYERLVQLVRRNEFEGITFPSPHKLDGTPSGYDFKLLSTGGNRQIDISGPIRRYERAIASIFHAQFITLGSEGSSGSWALSSDQTDMYGLSLGAILETIADSLNRNVVKELFELNGVPEDQRPKWRYRDVERRDTDRFSVSVQRLVDVGLVTPDRRLEEFLREEFELPPAEEATARVPAALPAPSQDVEGEVVGDAEEEAASPKAQALEKVRSYVPPVDVALSAQRALEVRAARPAHLRGMTPEVVRMARDLALRRPVPEGDLRRLKRFFDSHKDGDPGTPAWQSWGGCGGSAGSAWVRMVCADMDAEVPG